MNVKIKETGKLEKLSFVDRATGVNFVQDLIGNTGALGDGQFVWSEEDDAYLTEQHTYDWWAQYIADSEATEEEIEALAEELDIAVSVIRERIEEGMYGINDYEDHRGVAVQAMSDLRDDHAQ